jgi:hypothetical protein
MAEVLCDWCLDPKRMIKRTPAKIKQNGKNFHNNEERLAYLRMNGFYGKKTNHGTFRMVMGWGVVYQRNHKPNPWNRLNKRI